MCDTFGKRRATEALVSPCKRIKVIQGSYQPTCTSSAGESSKTTSEVAPRGNDREQPVADFESVFEKTIPTPIQYCGKISLQPEELLLYSLVKMLSPPDTINSFERGCTPEKYLGITKAVYSVYGVRFGCVNIRNYFYRSVNNITKALGKYNGYLRWKFYSNYIDNIIVMHKTVLLNLLLNSEYTNVCNYVELCKDLEFECLSALKESKLTQSLAYKISKVSDNLAHTFPKWKIIPNVKESKVFLYHKGNSPVNIEYEIIVSPDGSYQLFFKGKPRTLNLDCNQTFLPPEILNKNQLSLLMTSLEKFQLCSGICTENYLDLLPESNDTPVFNTVNGEPAAFVENIPTDINQKCIRSAKCNVFIKGGVCCKDCSQTNNYLRTLKSRSQKRNHTSSKYIRFDSMSKEKILEQSRKMAAKIHLMQVKIKRFEECKREMSTVGSNTDSDLRTLFQQLFNGLSKKVEKHNNNICYWDGCHLENEFKSPELLLEHIKSVHIKTVDDVAPINRKYTCEWLGCTKQFGKKKLLKTHIAEHTGRESDMFFITLLNDQAKALNMPSRQMRWHPLILKWCLRMYSKSHSIYSELRESVFLKLPSGRTLSDYKNFC